ncbi:MAG TPA: hypothetical protein VII47_06740 [Actinomycetota bacterium]|jgi:hypothetical protein
MRKTPPGPARSSPARSPSADEASAEDALETMITSLALSSVLAMPDAERDALFEHILSGEGVTVEREGDWVEIHLVGKTIATLDLHWLVRGQEPGDSPQT